MYLKIAEYIFVFVAVLLSILFSLRVYLPDMFKNSNKFSPVMAFLGALVLLYVLNSLVLVLLLPNIIYKFIMLLFAASPFIIGKLVRYEKLKFYSTIQILCVILSLVFVILV
jgi:hypothetical protein